MTGRPAGWLSLLGFFVLPLALQGQERSFHGLYFGAEAAREDFIGGSLVDGVDFLAQDMRGVASLVAGVRFETQLGIVVGVEGTWGATDGSLRLQDPARDLVIEYDNDTQTSIGGMLGFALEGSRAVLLLVYASEVTRHFAVRVEQGGSGFAQTDKQGMLRYGVAAEVAAMRGLHVRLRAGSGRADFGDARTNITPGKPIELGLSLAYQF